MDIQGMEWLIYGPLFLMGLAAYGLFWLFGAFYAWRGIKQLLPMNIGGSLIVLAICLVVPYIIAPAVYATLAFDKGKECPRFHRRDC